MRTTWSVGTANMPKGVVLAQVFLLGERQQPDVGHGLDMAWLDAEFVHGFAVVVDGLVTAFDGSTQPMQLQVFKSSRGRVSCSISRIMGGGSVLFCLKRLR